MMNEIELTKPEFELIRKLVFQHVGITLDETKESLVKNRLQKRLNFYGLQKFSDYIRIVQFNKDEASEMVNQITTNETYFFRESIHFEFLKKRARQYKSDKIFRVWSAAASFGAEAYSIAMVLESTLASKEYEIVGTDINTEVLKIATKGCYPLPWADKIDLGYKKHYCLKGKNSHEHEFLIDQSLQKKVSFSQANLLEPQKQLGKFDIIFLRNVLIYFNDATKQIVIANILDNLNDGGYLVISLTENLRALQNNQLQQVESSIYKKVTK